MRLFVVLSLVASLTGSGVAFAQNPTSSTKSLTKTQVTKGHSKSKKQAKKSKTKKKTKTSQNQISLPAPAPALTTAQEQHKAIDSQANSSTPVTAAANSTVAAQAVKPEEPAHWKFLYDMWSEAPVKDVANSEADGDVAEAFRATYKPTDVVSVSLTGQFSRNWGFAGKDRKFKAEDPYLMVAHSKLGTLPADIGISGYSRFYLPLSQNSGTAGQIMYVRAGLSFKKDLGSGFSLAYHPSPRFYIQNYDASRKFDEGKKAYVTKPNRSFRFNHAMELKWDITEKFNFTQDVGVDHIWYYGYINDKGESVDAERQDWLVNYSQLGYDFTKNFSLNLGIYQDVGNVNLLKQDKDFSAYRDDQSLYYLEATVTF